MVTFQKIHIKNYNRSKKGVTLAEVLIALAILAVIATFTIPKILATQQNQQHIAQAKEVAAMLVGALEQAKAAGVVNINTTPINLIPYMNYLSMVTDGTVMDSVPTGTYQACTASNPCLKMVNGGILWLQNWRFGGTSSLYTIEMIYDPDASNNTTDPTDGPLKAVQFTLYYDGFITTRGNMKPNTCNTFGCTNQPNSSLDPSWFVW
jgi:prepilin-type N-terminal cleavage/methylation domain-containing protein